MVDLEAVRLGLKGLPAEEIPSVRRVLADGWHFILPLVVVIGLLFSGYSPEFCAFWGTVSAAVLSWRRKETRKIGRATCRERVFQSVEHSVVTVSFKKK